MAEGSWQWAVGSGQRAVGRVDQPLAGFLFRLHAIKRFKLAASGVRRRLQIAWLVKKECWKQLFMAANINGQRTGV